MVRRPAEVSVLQAAWVALEGDDFGAVDGAVDHGGDGVFAEDPAPAAVLQPVVVVGGREAVDALGRGGEQDAVAGLASADRDPGGQVGLADPGWSEDPGEIPDPWKEATDRRCAGDDYVELPVIASSGV